MPEPLDVDDITEIARTVASLESPFIRVLETVLTDRRGNYLEAVVRIEGCATAPCTFVVGLVRNAPVTLLERECEIALRQHLAEHDPAP